MGSSQCYPEGRKRLGMTFSMNFGKNESDVCQMKSAESCTANTLQSNFRLADSAEENFFAPLTLCTEIGLAITYRPRPDFFVSLHVTLRSW